MSNNANGKNETFKPSDYTFFTFEKNDGKTKNAVIEKNGRWL